MLSEFFQIFQTDFLSGANLTDFAPLTIFFIFFFATFISEDAACIAAGAFAAQGKISFALAVSACFAGIFVGDILLYWTGRIFGHSIVKTKIFRRFVSETSVSKASDWLEKRGAAAVFLSRFVTGLRLPTYLAAGFLKTDFVKFTLYFLLASAIWTPLLIGSVAFSQNFLFSQNFWLGIILSFIVLKMFLHFLSWKNRRLFVGRIQRFLNWEFWSLRVFYFPVVVYVLFLAVRHRSLTVFTCANPAILAGGFIGESKNEIYRGLNQSETSHAFILPHILLSAEDSKEKKFSQFQNFIAEYNLDFPLVLKPDAGERGKDVKFLKDFSELETEIEHSDQNLILQKFSDGIEASIFYYRFPKDQTGKIFSITEKRFPFVTGDGKMNLEELILHDNRAVCLAKSYLNQNRESLETIPAKGAIVQIINIGTHSRGAVFLEGDWIKTDILENKIDEICRGFSGFYFGRFDIRTDSFEDLQQARNFKIIELNGVTSESTNIYDPKYSLFDAYKILFSQWCIAFEIGAENKKLGVKPTSVSDLIKLLRGKSIKTNQSLLTDDAQTVNN
ncbi:hypothetical protein BH20ACI4_BH20ACI4_01270 [soil metagenome]